MKKTTPNNKRSSAEGFLHSLLNDITNDKALQRNASLLVTVNLTVDKILLNNIMRLLR